MASRGFSINCEVAPSEYRAWASMHSSFIVRAMFRAENSIISRTVTQLLISLLYPSFGLEFFKICVEITFLLGENQFSIFIS